MGKLDGRIAVITGGASGLGRSIAELFSSEGATVAIMDVNGEQATEVANGLRLQGATSTAVQADVSDENSVSEAFEKSRAILGDADILVNNAGIDSTSLVEDMPASMWDEMISINLRSVFLCTKNVLTGMRKNCYGRIINVSSQLAQKGGAEMAHYAAAKAGIIGFTRSLSYEVTKYNITVNAICPGPLDTELFRKLPEAWRSKKLQELIIGRAGKVEEIAPTALMLASAEGGFYIGATLNPNGGDIMV